MVKRSTSPEPRNDFEREVYGELTELYGSAVTYEQEKIFYSTLASYLPDFAIRRAGKPVTYIECKGYLRQEDKRKLTNVKRQYPDLDLRIVFQKEPYIANQKWCKKHGIPWAIAHIPERWFLDVQPNARKPKRRPKKQRQLTFFRLLK